MITLGVLISGSGTNLQAILDAIEAGTLDARVALVLSNKEEAYGLERARVAGVEARAINPHDFASAHDYNEALRIALEEAGVEYVVMAGYMKLLGTEVLNAFPQRVLNLHPALLPSFPGAHGIADALAYGVKVTGVTVHFADEVFDRGAIIAQEAVVIREDDTEDSLAERIHEVEHRIYPAALQLIAEQRIEVTGRCVHIA